MVFNRPLMRTQELFVCLLLTWMYALLFASQEVSQLWFVSTPSLHWLCPANSSCLTEVITVRVFVWVGVSNDIKEIRQITRLPHFTLVSLPNGHNYTPYIKLYCVMLVQWQLFTSSSVYWSLISLWLPADPVEELNNPPAQTATNSAAELLKQGAGTEHASAQHVWLAYV